MNGQWHGKQLPDAGPPHRGPRKLSDGVGLPRWRGEDGWELVAVVAGFGGDVDNRTLYCRRDLEPTTESTELVVGNSSRPKPGGGRG